MPVVVNDRFVAEIFIAYDKASRPEWAQADINADDAVASDIDRCKHEAGASRWQRRCEARRGAGGNRGLQGGEQRAAGKDEWHSESDVSTD